VANFVNNIEYSPDHVFEVISIANEGTHTSGFAHKSDVAKLQFKDLEHGMTLKDKTIIKKITKDNFSNKQPFYFLHMAKTSGISLQEELKDVFKEEQMFINTAQYLNDDDMLNSKLISGHFAMYPIDLFKKNNKDIHAITMIRNPVDRAISFFIFRFKIHNFFLGRKTEMPTVRDFDLFLYEMKNLDFINNFQSRSMTSTLNVAALNAISNKYINGSIDRYQLTGEMFGNCHFLERSSNGSLWKHDLHKFDIIGTVDHRDIFLNKLTNLLEKNKYSSSFKNIKKNISEFEVEEIKKVLTKSQINKVIELNNYDFELYDFLMTKRGVFEC
jgi:hypothetical protein